MYLVEDSLIYAKDQCSPEDTEPLFFLHLDPVDRNDLPDHRKQYGFDNLDFAFGHHRIRTKGEVCAAVRELPDYAITSIRTGQFNGDGQIWNGGFDLAGPSGDGQAAPTSVPAPDPAATTSTPAGEYAALDFGGRCIMGQTLPDYPIARIRTGQFTPEGDRIWEAEFPVGSVEGEQGR